MITVLSKQFNLLRFFQEDDFAPAATAATAAPAAPAAPLAPAALAAPAAPAAQGAPKVQGKDYMTSLRLYPNNGYDYSLPSVRM